MMSESAIATVTKVLERLPDSAQEQLLQHLSEYAADLLDELEWDRQFQATRGSLGEAAARARDQIAAGLSRPLDPDVL